MIVLTIGSCVVVFVSSIILFGRELDAAKYDKVNVAAAIAENEIYELLRKAELAAFGIANNPDLVEALIGDDLGVIIRTANALKVVSQIDFLNIIDNKGNVISRTLAPEMYGDNISDQPHVEKALEGHSTSMITHGAIIQLGAYAGAPIYDSDMNLLGVVSLGFRLDSQEFAFRLRDLIGCEISVFEHDERISTTLVTEQGTYAVGHKALPEISDRVLAGEEFIDSVRIFSNEMLAKFIPLFGPGDEVVGMLFIAYDTTENDNKIFYFIMTGVFITLSVFALCILIAMFISRLVERQLKTVNEINDLQLTKMNMMVKATHIGLWDFPVLREDPFNPDNPIEFSDNFRNLCGYNNEKEFPNILSSWANLLHPDDSKRVHNALSAHLFDPTGKTPFNEEYRLLKKSGEYAYFSAVGETVRDKNGNPLRACGSLMDITEAKEMQLAISATNERLMLMLDTSPLCAQIWDRNLNTIECNEAAVRLYGFKNKQEYLRRFLTECSPEYQPDGEESGAKATRLVNQAFDEGYCTFEWLHIYPADGSLIPAEVTLVRAKYGDDDVVIGYTRDLREQKKFLEEIQEAHERTSLMLDAAPICVNFWDRNMKNIDCNQTAVNFFGLKDKQEYFDRFFELSPEYQPDGKQTAIKALEVVQKAFTDGYYRTEWMNQMLDGEPIPGELTLIRVRLKDEDVVMVYMRDLREQKIYLAEIEKARIDAELSNQAKSVFLANMSHEIRTPMNSIIGFSELALDDNISTKTKHYLVNISDNAKWLLNIINDILDSSKIESGKITLDNVPFDLQDVIEQCQSAILPKSAEKGLTLYCYAEPFEGKKLIGDPVRLRQAFMNLLSNAVKFTSKGIVKLIASIQSTDDDSATLKFEVKDSGIGMSAEHIGYIFEPFMQADYSVSRRYGGTGLGLTITKNIVELMGGSLSVESEPEAGTTFSFVLTFGLIDNDEIKLAEKAKLKDLEKPNFIGEVLVCEDNGLNQQVICEHLERVGLRTVVARDGKEGIDAVMERIHIAAEQSDSMSSSKPFDLIFMDVHMPVMDGLEASAIITAAGVKTPIVALTANIMSNDIELYKKSGMQGYLGKPFTSQDLWKCLTKYLPVVKYSAVDGHANSLEEEKDLKQLRLYFAKNNQTTFEKINEALDTGEIKLAHRLAHTLKSNAGQIGEQRLKEVAAKAEAMLINEENLLDEGIKEILGLELRATLEKLAPLLVEDKEKHTEEISEKSIVLDILDSLEPLLIERRPECLNYIDKLRAVPGAESLVKQVEDLEFKQAIEELSKLKEKYS